MEPIPLASFGKSHVKLIAVSVILLIAASFMRGGLKLGSFGFSSAQSAPEGLTLEEAKVQARQIVAERHGLDSDSAAMAEQAQAQLAEIDPTYGDGSVLGSSIGTDGNIDTDSILNSDAVNSIQINTYQTDDRLQLNFYASQVHAVESHYGAIALLGALGTREQSSLLAAQAGYKNIISELQGIKVPSQFSQYHKMKLVYYSALASMADSMASEGPNEQAATAASLFFSLNDKIDALRPQLESQYGVIL